MGAYLNPGNSGFIEMIQSEYVDKTGLIGLINNTINTKKKLTCISRPRRFVKLAYYTYREHYLQWEELPCGEGYADIVYLPKHDSEWPALVIELKWKDSAEGAISQILDRKYPESLEGFGSEIVLVGINYDKDAPGRDKKHSCKIIRMEK